MWRHAGFLPVNWVTTNSTHHMSDRSNQLTRQVVAREENIRIIREFLATMTPEERSEYFSPLPEKAETTVSWPEEDPNTSDWKWFEGSGPPVMDLKEWTGSEIKFEELKDRLNWSVEGTFSGLHLDTDERLFRSHIAGCGEIPLKTVGNITFEAVVCTDEIAKGLENMEEEDLELIAEHIAGLRLETEHRNTKTTTPKM